jgi:hypothetical protein
MCMATMGTITKAEDAAGSGASQVAVAIPARRRINWLAPLLSFASAASILLALLGYGVALAVEDRFGIPYSAIFSSSLDLFNLGGWAVMQIVLTMFAKLRTWTFYVHLWDLTWPITATIIFLTVIGAFLAFIVHRAWRRFGVRALKFLFAVNVDDGQSKLTMRRPGMAFAALAFGSFVMVGTPLLMVLGAIGIGILCLVLVCIPVIGLGAGQSYIDVSVIRPEACSSLSNRALHLQAPLPVPKTQSASCVAITRGTEQIARGRVVFATPSAIVLYDPATGSVRRVSTEGTIVEVIGVL